MRTPQRPFPSIDTHNRQARSLRGGSQAADDRVAHYDPSLTVARGRCCGAGRAAFFLPDRHSSVERTESGPAVTQESATSVADVVAGIAIALALAVGIATDLLIVGIAALLEVLR